MCDGGYTASFLRRVTELPEHPARTFGRSDRRGPIASPPQREHERQHVSRAGTTPTGTIIAFNGTTEWALDAVALGDAVWLPREDQLRDLLRGTFRRLERVGDAFVVEIEIAGETIVFEHPDPAEAYGRALLTLIRRSS